MSKLIRRLILSLALLAGITPAMGQVPPPVPALPDSERRTSYSITASTCACAVNFALYGDGTDYATWVEVFLNGTRVNFNDATFGWTITSPSGPLANLARPISNAVLTFTNAQTGTVQIVGARRPRRTSQFNEGVGVPTRNFNVVLSDLTAQNRETWDKINDVTGRALVSQPGVTLGGLPLPSSCANGALGFDATGLIPVCRSITTTGFVTLPVTVGHLPIFNSTTGLISDSGISPVGTSVRDPGTGTLESLLPIQAVTGASKVFAAADLYKKTRRSNAGSAMTDTLPASSAIGLINGTRINVANVDATASITVTAGSGTTINGSSSFVVGPSRDIMWVYDAANTAWRADANTSTALIGTSSTVVGTIPYFSNTTGNALSGAPVFQSGNPGNATLFNQTANPANGYTTVYNGLQFSLGAFFPAGQQFGANAIGVQQAIVGTLDIAADPSSTRPVQGNGIAGYARTNVGNGFTSAVGIFGQASMTAAGASIFGVNGIDQNCDLVITGCGLNFNFGAAGEFDHNVWQKSGALDPTATGGNSYGVWITGGGDIVGPLGNGITVHYAGIINNAKWVNAFWSRPGAAVTAFMAGPTADASNQGSQPVCFQRTDGSNSILTAACIKADVASNLLFDPGVGAIVSFRDGSGNSLMSGSSSFGGSGVRIPGLSAAGVVTNDSNGQLVTSTNLGATLGGTGQSAYVLGDTLYSPSANTLFRLPGNTTATKKFLRQTGTGTVSAAPAWDTVVAADIPGSALTKTDDTNVTLTLGGSPTTALLNATSLTLGWTGQLPASRGGTGLSSLGTGVATALGINVGSAGAFVTNGGALGTPSSGVGTNLTGTAAGLTAGTVTTNANLTGDVTSVGNATTLTNAPVIAKVLTGYTSGAGTVSAADSILSAIQKLNGNDALKSPIASPTFTGTATVPTLAATTINAFTLAGTISGGGNNLNNIIIGATTPLAITGTTITANTSFTAPNGSAGGYKLKASGGAADGAFYENASNQVIISLGSAGTNAFGMLNSASNAVLDYSVSTAGFWTMAGGLIMNSSGISINTATPAGAGNLLAVGTVQTGKSVVGSLPTCNAAAEGARYGVTDALAPTFGGTLTGGGAVHTSAYCNGTAWIGA